MAALIRLAPLLALAKATPQGAELLLATCNSSFVAFAERGSKIDVTADWSKRLLLAENSPNVQLAVTVLLMLFWKVTFKLVHQLVFRFEQRPWYAKALLRTIEGGKKSCGIDIAPEDASRIYANNWAISLQHTVSSFLCIPAMFSLVSPEFGSALTRHATLSEVAWEVMDIFEMWHRRYVSPGGALGRKVVPGSLIFVMACHHFMATTMVMPVNCYYSDIKSYAALVFSLQFAAAASLTTSSYVYSLDLMVPSELRQMQGLAVYQVCVTASLRGVLFIVSVFDLVCTFRSDQALVFLVLSVPAVLGMSYLNWIFIYDAWCRMRKFARWSPEKQGPPAERREPTGASTASTAPEKQPLAKGPAPPVLPRAARRMSAGSIAAVEFATERHALCCWRRRRASLALAREGEALAGYAPLPSMGRRPSVSSRRSSVCSLESSAPPSEGRAAATRAGEFTEESVGKASSDEASSPLTPDTISTTGLATSDDAESEASSDFGASSCSEEL